MMDCCKSSRSRAESLERLACCEFQMAVAAEPHPARLTSIEIGFQPPIAPCATSDSVYHSFHAASSLRSPDSFAASLKDSSPPIFLLNESLLY
jgi:hypothetical protein